MFRIGNGYDSHRFEVGRKLILGGIEIPFEKGLLGHSDADVLCHAIIDALLGSIALGNIGLLFPDTDKKYKDADSIELLRTTYSKILENNYKLVNIDCTIICERPKLSLYVPSIIEKLADTMDINLNQISIKPKSNEKMGFIGRKEGIAVLANVLVECNN